MHKDSIEDENNATSGTAEFRSIAKVRVLTAIAGFVGYGVWASLVNMEHGLVASVKAGLVQGSVSFILTLSVNYWIEWLYRSFERSNFRDTLTVLVASLSLVLVSFSINFIAGTPNIILTILPGAIFGSFYVYSYLRYNVKKVFETD
jgi:hypothetical protein